MITPNREAVIENIKIKANQGKLNDKVEIGDPALSPQERDELLKKYIKVRKGFGFKTKNFIAGRLADIFTFNINKNTQIVGLEKIKDIKSGAIITSNHFNPDENTTIRRLAQKRHRGNLYVVSQDTNLKMPGLFGFFMYYMDIIPVSSNANYMNYEFDKLIDEALKRGQDILIYPEQEMWFNYRKPRPHKRGAYLYAARHNVPVISVFNEIVDLPEVDTGDFHKVYYVTHILDPIYPDPNLSERENSFVMANKDYEQKCRAYEEIYGKKLTYDFEESDIAGWESGLVKKSASRVVDQEDNQEEGRKQA